MGRVERSGGMGSGRGGAGGMGGGERSGAMGSMAGGVGMLELSSGSTKGDDGFATDRRMARMEAVAAGRTEERRRDGTDRLDAGEKEDEWSVGEVMISQLTG